MSILIIPCPASLFLGLLSLLEYFLVALETAPSCVSRACYYSFLLLLPTVQRSVNLAHFSLTISFFYFYFSFNILAFLCPSVSTTSILNVVLQGAQTNREGMGGARYIKRFDWTVSAMEINKWSAVTAHRACVIILTTKKKYWHIGPQVH